MNLKKRIPKEFYKLFGSKYMDYYMTFLVDIYEETSRSYSELGQTEEECKAIINETLPSYQVNWEDDEMDTDGALLGHGNMASICLGRFIKWGWLKSEFDETLNCNVVFFPEYSQLYVELFRKLLSEDGEKERESILAIYSYLFTYHSDPEKNNEILKSALTTTRRLVQLMVNMQEGMRTYFDELSQQKAFRGIQEVLVREINNSDSRKYAILTTTDSFYRYKEAVRELIIDCLSDNEKRKQDFEIKKMKLEEHTASYIRNERAIAVCEEAMETIYQIEREFNLIEIRYNKLIEQKTIFASRAVARMRYIMQEGAEDEERTITLVNLLSRSSRKEEILQAFMETIPVSSPYRIITEQSFYSKREREQRPFQPQPVQARTDGAQEGMDDYILRPLYTKRELRRFMSQNMEDGRFQATEKTVQSIEDLEKLLFVWQDATEQNDGKQKVELGTEVETEDGFRFSRLTIEEEK